MERERWQRMKELFGRALELPGVERESLLLEIEADDPSLRKEVESLLAAHSEEFLEMPLSIGDDFEDAPPRPEPPGLIGIEVGGLRIVERIATGGLGEVYRAVEPATSREVALKRLLTDALSDPKQRARFRQEARAAMALRHPNVVTVHGVLDWEGEILIVMDLVEGRTLRNILNEGPLSTEEALGYAIQITDGLTKAHELGIIHRDVKPENLMVTRDGSVKVLDFGIAKLIAPQNTREAPTHDRQSLSRQGVVLGSASYISPEQVEGLAVDGRSDVFSLGAVLYEMVTGARAFDGETVMDVIAAVLRGEPRMQALGKLEPVIGRALDKLPARRYPTMAAFGDALREIRGF